jgi:hypothetical protein
MENINFIYRSFYTNIVLMFTDSPTYKEMRKRAEFTQTIAFYEMINISQELDAGLYNEFGAGYDSAIAEITAAFGIACT